MTPQLLNTPPFDGGQRPVELPWFELSFEAFHRSSARVARFLFVGAVLQPFLLLSRAVPTCAHTLYQSSRFLSNEEAIPEGILNLPVPLVHGIGNAQEKVTTSSGRAQLYYDQGLSFLYSYDWIYAARSFHEALRLDPNLAMACVGLSNVYSAIGDNNRARAMADKAIGLASRVTPTERVRADLRLQQLGTLQGQSPGHVPEAFINALDDALKSEGNNINLLLMRGIASEGYAMAIGQRGGQESIQYYQKVLAVDPDNAAAHHFLIHSNEMIGNIPEALKHGEAYQRLAPSVAHAHHMYGHDLRRTDRIQEAITQFEKANELAEATYRSEPQTLLYDWNYRHNLNLLGSTYAQAGRSSAAAQTFMKLAELPSITPADDLYKAQYAGFLLREDREKDAIAAATSFGNSQFEVGRVLSHALAASAFARLGDAAHAKDESLAAESELSKLAPEWRQTVLTRMEILRAQMELLQGNRNKAVSRLRTRVLEIRSLPGSDAWSDLIFHLHFIAKIAMDANEWDLARFVGRQLEDKAPYYFGAHAVMARIAAHDNDQPRAHDELELAKKLTLQ